MDLNSRGGVQTSTLQPTTLHSAVRRGVCVDLNSRGGVQTSTLLTSTLLRGPNDGEGLLCVCWPRHIPHTSSTDSISAVHTSPLHQRATLYLTTSKHLPYVVPGTNYIVP